MARCIRYESLERGEELEMLGKGEKPGFDRRGEEGFARVADWAWAGAV
jgi:hypothetical protein